MFNQLLVKLSLRVASRDIVKSLYLGCLDQLPEPSKLDEYARGLSKKNRFEQLIREIAQSDVAWQNAVQAHASELVSALYEGILARAPDSGALTSKVAGVRDVPQIQAIARELVTSEEAWQNAVQAHASELVSALYEGILGRSPAPEVLATEISGLADVMRLGEIACKLANSEEARNKFLVYRIEEIVNAIVQGFYPDDEIPAEILSEPVIPESGLGGLLPLIGRLRENLQNLRNDDKESLIRTIYRTLLNREADSVGLEAHCSHLTYLSDFPGILSAFVASEEYKNNTFLQCRNEVLRSLSTCGDQDDLETISSALSLANNASDIVKLFRELKSPESMLGSAYRNANPGVAFQVSRFEFLATPRKTALVFVPSETWLPFALSIAGHLKMQEGVEAILIWLEWSPGIAKAVSMSPCIYASMSFRDFKKIPESVTFSPSIFVTHSYGWEPQNIEMIERFPSVRLFVYADAYKNEVDSVLGDRKQIEGAFFFGYMPKNRGFDRYHIISTDDISAGYDRLADIYDFNIASGIDANFQGEYAVVYLRYWGVGPYAFPIDMVVQIMLDTIMKGIGDIRKLVVKRDMRASTELFELVRSALVSRGCQVYGYDLYLSQHGVDVAYANFPVELLLNKGLLRDAACHIVFDSSLSYLLATSPHISGRKKLVVGADLGEYPVIEVSEFSRDRVKDQLLQERGIASRSVETGLSTIRFYSKHYADALLETVKGAEMIGCDGNAYYEFFIGNS